MLGELQVPIGLLVGLARPFREYCERIGGRGPALAQAVDGLIGEPVEFAGLDVTLDLAIEAIGLELFEPGAELRVLVGRQACDGFFEVFDAHNADIICDFSHSNESFPRFLIDFRCSRDAANLNIRCRNCKNSPRTRSNSAARWSSNRVHPL
jgi:hypothetical protein